MLAMSSLPPLAGPDFHCARCALHYPSMTVAYCRELLAMLPGRFATAVSGVDDQALRTRPDPGVWSTVEYLCHVRDVYATYTIRLHRTRTEEQPQLEPMLNDLRARRFRYNELAVTPVLEQLSANLAGFGDEIDRMGDADWTRTATRQPHELRDARWLVRQATHEGVHHLGDIAG